MNSDRIGELSTSISNIDDGLIDTADANLDVIVETLDIFTLLGILTLENICGLIGKAYAAGRMRGRKESVMREMLEGVADD